MRARIKFTTNCYEENLIAILKEHHWWPGFDQHSDAAQDIVRKVRDSLDDEDVNLFDSVKKIVLSHTATESYGTLTQEHDVWVVRLLNPSVQSLQRACSRLVTQLVDHAIAIGKCVEFADTIQIVERKRKEKIIEGETLETAEHRKAYARAHRRTEFRISQIGFATLVVLLILTAPWFGHLANAPAPWVAWGFSVLEKLIGSAAVTTVISFIQYQLFLQSLKSHTIRWFIPGEPQQIDLKPQPTAA